jgi:hypothetical protein
MFIDRELVLPKALDPYFPRWLNHLMHTMIMVTTALEMLIVPRQYPKRSQGLGVLIGFMLIYLAWCVFYVFQMNNLNFKSFIVYKIIIRKMFCISIRDKK